MKKMGGNNLHTKFTAAGIIFDAFVIVWTHTFQYMRFIVDNMPIIELIRFGIDWQPWNKIIVDLWYNTKKFIHSRKISKTLTKIYLHIVQNRYNNTLKRR